jgi:hypothetical protein
MGWYIKGFNSGIWFSDSDLIGVAHQIIRIEHLSIKVICNSS